MKSILVIIGGVLLGISILLLGGSLKLPIGYKKLAFIPGMILITGIILIIIGTLGDITSSAPGTNVNPIVPSGGAVGPAFDTIPGHIKITNVAQSKSTPGVFISFSHDGMCSQCQAVFDLNLMYNDGTVDSKEVTTSVTDQQVYADYSPNMRPLPPGPVQMTIVGFSINPLVSGSQGPISEPYIQLVAKENV